MNPRIQFSRGHTRHVTESGCGRVIETREYGKYISLIDGLWTGMANLIVGVSDSGGQRVVVVLLLSSSRGAQGQDHASFLRGAALPEPSTKGWRCKCSAAISHHQRRLKSLQGSIRNTNTVWRCMMARAELPERNRWWIISGGCVFFTDVQESLGLTVGASLDIFDWFCALFPSFFTSMAPSLTGSTWPT